MQPSAHVHPPTLNRFMCRTSTRGRRSTLWRSVCGTLPPPPPHRSHSFSTPSSCGREGGLPAISDPRARQKRAHSCRERSRPEQRRARAAQQRGAWLRAAQQQGQAPPRAPSTCTLKYSRSSSDTEASGGAPPACAAGSSRLRCVYCSTTRLQAPQPRHVSSCCTCGRRAAGSGEGRGSRLCQARQGTSGPRGSGGGSGSASSGSQRSPQSQRCGPRGLRSR